MLCWNPKTGMYSAAHKEGVAILASDNAVLYGCNVCSGVYWAPRFVEGRHPDRCIAFTKAGDRCKLPREGISGFCKTHQPKSSIPY